MSYRIVPINRNLAPIQMNSLRRLGKVSLVTEDHFLSRDVKAALTLRLLGAVAVQLEGGRLPDFRI